MQDKIWKKSVLSYPRAFCGYCSLVGRSCCFTELTHFSNIMGKLASNFPSSIKVPSALVSALSAWKSPLVQSKFFIGMKCELTCMTLITLSMLEENSRPSPPMYTDPPTPDALEKWDCCTSRYSRTYDPSFTQLTKLKSVSSCVDP